MELYCRWLNKAQEIKYAFLLAWSGYHRIGLVVGYVNRWGDGGLNFLHLIFAFCA